jgi:hypothetical protein
VGNALGTGAGHPEKWLYLVLEGVAEPDEVVVVGGAQAHVP